MLGHVRYGTFGKNGIESVHPFLWWPEKNRSGKDRLRNNSMAKPYRAWYIILDKEEWNNR